MDGLGLRDVLLLEAMSDDLELDMGDLSPYLAELEHAVRTESNFQAHLKLPSAVEYALSHKHLPANQQTDVTAGHRDGAAHVLRCLKVWYEMPNDVLFAAINYMDRFLSKMKAQPKHMACISVSCFHLAAEEVAREGGRSLDLRDLSVISQCNCTPSDLERMGRIVYAKLNVSEEGLPLTPLNFLRIYQELFLASEFGPLYKEMVGIGSQGGDISHFLEIVVCDATCANFRPSIVALVVLYTLLQMGLEATPVAHSKGEINKFVAFAIRIQKLSDIHGSDFADCFGAVMTVLGRYNARTQMPHRQRLSWKVSTRTMRVLRPTDRYNLVLPTINEQLDHRSRSSSLSSDESFESCTEGFESEKEEGILSPDDWHSVNPANWASQ